MKFVQPFADYLLSVIVFDRELANAVQGITTSSLSVTFCKPFTHFKAYSKYEGTASEFLSFNIGNIFKRKVPRRKK